MSNKTKEAEPGKHTMTAHVIRFIGWWFGFTGLYAMFSVCPFCGQSGCPVGAGAAGIFGGFFALIMKSRTLYGALLSKLRLKKGSNQDVSQDNHEGENV